TAESMYGDSYMFCPLIQLWNKLSYKKCSLKTCNLSMVVLKTSCLLWDVAGKRICQEYQKGQHRYQKEDQQEVLTLSLLVVGWYSYNNQHLGLPAGRDLTYLDYWREAHMNN